MLKLFKILAVISLAGVPAYAGGGLETQFARQRSHLTCYEGPTDEPSCGGTWLKVYTRGKSIQKLEWENEMSQRLIRREFYFQRGKLRLVIERSYFLLDDEAYRLAKPRCEYCRRVWISPDSKANRSRRALVREANYLLRQYRTHRAQFVARSSAK
jgi:hypothetical protein